MRPYTYTTTVRHSSLYEIKNNFVEGHPPFEKLPLYMNRSTSAFSSDEFVSFRTPESSDFVLLIRNPDTHYTGQVTGIEPNYVNLVLRSFDTCIYEGHGATYARNNRFGSVTGVAGIFVSLATRPVYVGSLQKTMPVPVAFIYLNPQGKATVCRVYAEYVREDHKATVSAVFYRLVENEDFYKMVLPKLHNHALFITKAVDLSVDFTRVTSIIPGQYTRGDSTYGYYPVKYTNLVTKPNIPSQARKDSDDK